MISSPPVGGPALNHRLFDGVRLQAARHREDVDDLQLQCDLILSGVSHRSENVDRLRAVFLDEHGHLRILDHLAVEQRRRAAVPARPASVPPP